MAKLQMGRTSPLGSFVLNSAMPCGCPLLCRVAGRGVRRGLRQDRCSSRQTRRRWQKKLKRSWKHLVRPAIGASPHGGALGMQQAAHGVGGERAGRCSLCDNGGGGDELSSAAGTSGGIYSSTAGLRGATVAHTCGEGSCRESADQSVEIVGKPRRSDANNKSFAPNATEISSYLVTRVLFRNSTKNGEDSIFDCCRF